MRDVIPEKELIVLYQNHEAYLKAAQFAVLSDAPDQAETFLRKAYHVALTYLPKEEARHRVHSGFYGRNLWYEG